MIYSRIERIATVGIALFMICAAVAYLYVMGTLGLESAGYSWKNLCVGDLILIMFPAFLLLIYAILLLKFYRVRGLRIHSTWSELDGSAYKGSKFPDLY